MTKASDNAFPSILITEGTEPSAPAAGKQRLYIDSTTHKLKRTDSSGTDVTIESSGSVATDTIFDAKGDLAVGTGADTASKLTVGANGTHLVAASGEATGLKWEGVGWTDYTPTVGATPTPPTQGSSVIAGRYKMLDAKTMVININWTITTGGAWNAGSGAYTFTLPGGFTASATMEQQLAGKFLDSGTDNKCATGTIGVGATTVVEVVVEGVNTFSNSSPVTLATGDKLVLSGIIEIQ